MHLIFAALFGVIAGLMLVTAQKPSVLHEGPGGECLTEEELADIKRPPRALQITNALVNNSETDPLGLATAERRTLYLFLGDVEDSPPPPTNVNCSQSTYQGEAFVPVMLNPRFIVKPKGTRCAAFVTAPGTASRLCCRADLGALGFGWVQVYQYVNETDTRSCDGVGVDEDWWPFTREGVVIGLNETLPVNGSAVSPSTAPSAIPTLTPSAAPSIGPITLSPFESRGDDHDEYSAGSEYGSESSSDYSSSSSEADSKLGKSGGHDPDEYSGSGAGSDSDYSSSGESGND